jgi:DNA-binding transcriptional ArsR family regulator
MIDMIDTQFIETACLIGEPVRATIMWALMEGRAMTATELAMVADTSPQNISMHLSKLVGAGLLSAESQGRYKYYTFARTEIAYAIESMAILIPSSSANKSLAKEKEPMIKECRTCYDHLAGKVGVALTEGLLDQKLIISGESKFELSSKGFRWFSNFGLDINALMEERRSFIRPCLDWSERRYHLAGSLASAFLDEMVSLDWLRKIRNSRTVLVTAKGRKAFYDRFGFSA